MRYKGWSLRTNTCDRGQELGLAVKAENLEGQAVKGTSQIRKSQGSSTVKVNRIQNLIKARYHTLNSVKSKAYLSDGQAVKALIKVKFFDRAVAGVGTESPPLEIQTLSSTPYRPPHIQPATPYQPLATPYQPPSAQ